MFRLGIEMLTVFGVLFTAGGALARIVTGARAILDAT